jgi:hypothetical protein
MENFLGTNNSNYIQMYLSFIYSKYISDVNQIYQTIKDPEFSIHIKLAEVELHKKLDPQLVVKPKTGQNQYMYHVNNHFFELYNKSLDNSCDLVFFMVNKGLDPNVLGLAYVKSVCQPTLFTSVILHSLQSKLYLTLAHELAHILGAFHDNDQESRFKSLGHSDLCNEHMLMHSFVSADKLGHSISQCTILDIKKSLFDLNGNFNSKYQCLVEQNSSRNLVPYRQVENSLHGYLYSFTDQCEMATMDRNSFYDYTFLPYNCRLNCFYSFDQSKLLGFKIK